MSLGGDEDSFNFLKNFTKKIQNKNDEVNKADSTVVNVKEQKAIDYSNIKGFNEITELILTQAHATP